MTFEEYAKVNSYMEIDYAHLPVKNEYYINDDIELSEYLVEIRNKHNIYVEYTKNTRKSDVEIEVNSLLKLYDSLYNEYKDYFHTSPEFDGSFHGRESKLKNIKSIIMEGPHLVLIYHKKNPAA